MTTDPTAAGLLGIHALTALHPGAGTALGTVDLPVQRERHTHWPTIAGSALKGILRDTYREQVKTKSYPADEMDGDKVKRTRRDQANADGDITALFGPPHRPPTRSSPSAPRRRRTTHPHGGTPCRGHTRSKRSRNSKASSN